MDEIQNFVNKLNWLDNKDFWNEQEKNILCMLISFYVEVLEKELGDKSMYQTLSRLLLNFEELCKTIAFFSSGSATKRFYLIYLTNKNNSTNKAAIQDLNIKLNKFQLNFA